jgi:hypothetical protein
MNLFRYDKKYLNINLFCEINSKILKSYKSLNFFCALKYEKVPIAVFKD